MSKSYQPPDRSTYDPGWNDPPPMPTAATASVNVSAKPRTSLNKRIAFPMQSGASANSSNVKTTAEGLPLPFSTAKYKPSPMNSTPEQIVPAALPPPPPPVAIFNPSENVISTEPTPSDEAFDSTKARDFCHSIFMRLVDGLDAGKLTEIRKRIELLNETWDKLDEPVQRNLHDLGEALDKNDANSAKEQHRLLVTHHTNVSAQWATALRQIIHSISTDESEPSDEPLVLPDNEINVVQFMDVSSEPVVLDATPFVPINSPSPPSLIEPIPFVTESNVETFAPQESEESVKPKSGRFGPILHL